MKKACLGFLLIYILGLSACGFRIEDLPPLPTLAVEAEVSEASDGTVTPGGSDPGAVTPDVKPTGTLPAEPTAVPVTPPERPTATPKPTVTAKPTVTSAPTVTSVPTVTPTPTVTPRPTVTPTPTVTLKPTATPKPISAEIERLLELGAVYPNTVIRGEVCTSKAETDEYLREKTLKYSSFAVIAERPEYLQSAKEYMEQYPEIENMAIEKIDRYDNGYCAVFKDVETVYDANLCYAIRTGDRSVLTDVEKEIYQYLNAVRKGLEADSLDTVEKVRVFHDYLVLELKYDTTIQEISHSPEGVMRNRRAVCDGYARTLRLLLLMTGVESKIVCGAVRSESHAWNLVRMEDGWYHVDVTWDDPVPDVEGKVGYHYFLKNDAEMSRTHTWESGISCTENRYQLYMYRDVLCDSRDTMQKVYESQVTEKEYMLFCYPKGGELNEDLILDFLMEELNCGLTYYPEKELEDYMVFEVVNPLWE